MYIVRVSLVILFFLSFSSSSFSFSCRLISCVWDELIIARLPINSLTFVTKVYKKLSYIVVFSISILEKVSKSNHARIASNVPWFTEYLSKRFFYAFSFFFLLNLPIESIAIISSYFVVYTMFQWGFSRLTPWHAHVSEYIIYNVIHREKERESKWPDRSPIFL